MRHQTFWLRRSTCLLMAGLTACSTSQTSAPRRDVNAAAVAPASGTYQTVSSWGSRPAAPNTVTDPKIAPGFLLNLLCPEDSKLDGDYRVELNGDLRLPYEIRVNATGDALSQLKKKIANAYRPYFKTAYQINLQVKEQRYWLDVRGLVEKPGKYLVDPEDSLDTVVGLAGGLRKDPAPLYVRIQKDPKVFVFDLNRYYTGESNAQILGWLGGEILFFQRESNATPQGQAAAASSRLQVRILGEVRSPGEYALNPQSDFVDAVVQAGGFTERADLDHIEVIRQAAGGRSISTIAWSKIERASAPQNGDLVMVHADRTPSSERKITLTSAIISALAAVVTSTVIVLSYNKGRF